jgi:GcvH upstream region-like protein
MLDFFRTYQRYFFLVITVIIVISFSFFGTYNALGSNTWHDSVVFKAVNGHDVTRADVDEMAHFISTDNEDKLFYGGSWGPNFLNDGVIRKNFLETGLLHDLVKAYPEELKGDIEKRLAKEKKYALYTHPQAKFLGIETIWTYFAPQMNNHFNRLQSSKNGLDKESLESRIQLYLGQTQLPPQTLTQILRYQEQQYNWLTPDPNLYPKDLFLFGYYSFEDWFGPYATRLISEFIINSAILAEQQGYTISNGEVLADLIYHAQVSYRQNQENPQLGVASLQEYFNEQLRILNIDQSRAIKIWKQVLLFRRYFQDAASTALVDSKLTQQLQKFSSESVVIDLYRLPEGLRLSKQEDLKNFEAYLQAVAKPNSDASLALPQEFLPVTQVAALYPELVQKKYDLEVSQISSKSLQTRITLRELWAWEVSDANWEKIRKNFADLGIKEGKTTEERFQLLNSLDSTTRTRVDAFAKQQIVKEHPEWIEEALNKAKFKKMIVGIRTKGGKIPFEGLQQKEKRAAFMHTLDQAPLHQKPTKESPLYIYSADQKNYYRIQVEERADQPEIISFKEAKNDGTLDQMNDRILQNYYERIREQIPTLYPKDQQAWPLYETVKEGVNKQFLERTSSLLNAVKTNLPKSDDTEEWTQDRLVTLRFYPYLQEVKRKIENNTSNAEYMIKGAQENALFLEVNSTLANQWKLEKETLTIDRNKTQTIGNISEIFDLEPGTWSPIKIENNGDLLFFQVKEQGKQEEALNALINQTNKWQALLGDEAEGQLMQEILKIIKEKDAISLDYLKIADEPITTIQSEVEETG